MPPSSDADATLHIHVQNLIILGSTNVTELLGTLFDPAPTTDVRPRTADISTKEGPHSPGVSRAQGTGNREDGSMRKHTALRGRKAVESIPSPLDRSDTEPVDSDVDEDEVRRPPSSARVRSHSPPYMREYKPFSAREKELILDHLDISHSDGRLRIACGAGVLKEKFRHERRQQGDSRVSYRTKTTLLRYVNDNRVELTKCLRHSRRGGRSVMNSNTRSPNRDDNGITSNTSGRMETSDEAPFSPTERALVLSALTRDAAGVQVNISGLLRTFSRELRARRDGVEPRSAQAIQKYLDENKDELRGLFEEKERDAEEAEKSDKSDTGEEMEDFVSGDANMEM